jgi:hypothetical protein
MERLDDHEATCGLTCEEVDALLPLVADGVLDVESDPTLFAHLAACSDCQTALVQHDLITLALGTVPTPSAPAVNVVHMRLPLRWVGAAAAVLAIAAFAAMWAGAPAPTDAPQVASQEIIRVRDSQGGEHPVLLIRQGNQSTLVDPNDLDRLRGDEPAADPRATPVRWRY